MTDQAIAMLAPRIGTRAACAASGVAQASWYRRHCTSPAPVRRPPVPHRGRVQPRALSPAERAAILAALHAERFADTAPAEVWATLLDEGTYLGSLSTFYRLLRAAGETRERRTQATHPAAVKPELIATGPNQVWSWDITKLHGPAKWTYYHLYVIPGIYSRYAVGWMAATRESAAPPTSASSSHTPGRTSVMTIRTQKRSSRPSNTGQASPPASPRSRPPGRTARSSSLVQHPAPALRAGPAHRGRRPPRHSRSRPGQPRPRPGRRLPPAPRAVRLQAPRPATTARDLLDQPTRERSRRSVDTPHRRLIQVDRFRTRLHNRDLAVIAGRRVPPLTGSAACPGM